MKRKITCALLALLVMVAMIYIPASKVEAKDSDGNIVIVIDAGHGSVDGGATKNGVKESELNWSIATELKAELQTYWGVEVYLTRGSSEWQSNTGRGRTGLAVDADFTISVHNNSYNETSTGVEAYYTLNPSYSEFTGNMAKNICSNISALGITNRGAKTRQSSQGGIRDYYTFIDEAVRAGIPAVLVECCYISNPNEAAFIGKAENQKKVGVAIASAVAKSFGLSKRGVADGTNITLTRTYSATFVSDMAGGTYASTNTSVATVNSNGIITASGTGEADITYTGTDGTVETVHVVVPEVKMVALAAGISPTFYGANEDFNPADVIVKALYSDGTAKQVKGYTLGKLPASSNGIYDIPITYSGLTGSLRVYKTVAAGSGTGGATYTPGTNTDIIRYPDVIQSINTGINVTLTPVYSSFVAGEPVLNTPNTPDSTVKPTEPTTQEPTTPEPTTVAPTETSTETEEDPTTTSTESDESESTSTETQENTSESEKDSSTENETGSNVEVKGRPVIMWSIIGIGGVIVLVGIGCIIIFATRNHG